MFRETDVWLCKVTHRWNKSTWLWESHSGHSFSFSIQLKLHLYSSICLTLSPCHLSSLKVWSSVTSCCHNQLFCQNALCWYLICVFYVQYMIKLWIFQGYSRSSIIIKTQIIVFYFIHLFYFILFYLRVLFYFPCVFFSIHDILNVKANNVKTEH